jgi:hypothetical protein
VRRPWPTGGCRAVGKMNPYVNFRGMLSAVQFADETSRGQLTENLKGVSDGSDVAQDRDRWRAGGLL